MSIHDENLVAILIFLAEIFLILHVKFRHVSFSSIFSDPKSKTSVEKRRSQLVDSMKSNVKDQIITKRECPQKLCVSRGRDDCRDQLR